MSTNYFNPISYRPMQPVSSPVQMPGQTSFTLPARNPGWGTVTGWSPTGQVAAPNQGQIQGLLGGLYGSGTPGQAGYVPGLNERVATQFGQARNNARDSLRGFGGITFRQDDPSTPNVDESLMVDYQPDKLGSNERRAVLAARAQANARGMMSSGFGDQMVGAALQRVGEDARAIINQYSTQINQIATQNFDPLTGLAATTLGQIQSLYGSDTQWSAQQELLKPPPAPAPAAAEPAPQPAPAPEAAAPRQVWIGTNYPNLKSLRSTNPNMDLRVEIVPGPMGNDRYRVIATPRAS